MLLEIKGLKAGFGDKGKSVEVLRGIDLEIEKGECVGLVGESGCGKTTVGLSITRLLPAKKSAIAGGRVLLNEKDVLALDSEGLRKIRGRKISYVFQEPSSSLNPIFTIYEQLKEALPEIDDADSRIADILKSVGLGKIAGKKNVYPHELSGGMQQRAMIAMAIVSRPDLLILDEPTTALDVTIQKQILDLILELKKKLELSILFISHDLRVVFSIADSIACMYAGIVVEKAATKGIVSQPSHPYTIALMESIPSIQHRKKRFNAIEGRAPLFSDLPKGCKFYPRCRYRIDKCNSEEPGMTDLGEGHFSRCIRSREIMNDRINKG